MKALVLGPLFVLLAPFARAEGSLSERAVPETAQAGVRAVGDGLVDMAGLTRSPWDDFVLPFQEAEAAAQEFSRRAEYERKVRSIRAVADRMLAEEKSEEEVARRAHAQRRLLGSYFKYYRGMTPRQRLELIHERNLAKYGNKWGPTIRWLRAQGKTWREIIDGACAPGGADIYPKK